MAIAKRITEVNPAMGKSFEFTVKRKIARVINDSDIYMLIDGNGNTLNVSKDEMTDALQPGQTVLVETRGIYCNVIEVVTPPEPSKK